MTNQRNRLYLITGIVCFFGLIWLFLDYFTTVDQTICPVKLVTGYPCPSCGTTRSITALLHGDVVQAFMINPFGIISSILVISVIALLILDVFAKKDYYFKTYVKVEQFLQQHKIISVILVLLVIANWIWNISKGL